MARKPTEYVQFKLRIREGLRSRIEREAKKKDQSANNEAVERLEQSFSLEKKENRDAAVVDFLAGDREEGRDLLRWLVFQLQINPDWWTQKGRSGLADAFREYVAPQLPQGGVQ
jgi:hypothetical protein